ncbi:hypothetical protein KBD18_02340, partial [Patescibacteria group bacterium]|nr:hypothetical protein [Patescibacteria group bacterium]
LEEGILNSTQVYEDCRSETANARAAAMARVEGVARAIESSARFLSPPASGVASPPVFSELTAKYELRVAVPRVIGGGKCELRAEARDVLVRRNLGYNRQVVLAAIGNAFGEFAAAEAANSRDLSSPRNQEQQVEHNDSTAYLFFTRLFLPVRSRVTADMPYHWADPNEAWAAQQFGKRLLGLMNDDTNGVRMLGSWSIASATRLVAPHQQPTAALLIRQLYAAASSDIEALDRAVAGAAEQKYGFAENKNYLAGSLMRRFREVRDDAGDGATPAIKLAKARAMIVRLRFWCVEAARAFRLPEHQAWATEVLAPMTSARVDEEARAWYIAELTAISTQP